MASFLVCYGTGAGVAEPAMERCVDRLEERGHATTSVEAAVFPSNVAIDGFDAIVVGAAGHLTTPESAVHEFVAQNRGALSDQASALVGVSPAPATDDPDLRTATAVALEGFQSATGFDPDRTAVLGGSLRFAKYGFLDRLAVERLAASAEPDEETDTDWSRAGWHRATEAPDRLLRDWAVAREYEEWATADPLAADLAAFVEGRLGVAPPGADGLGIPSDAPPEELTEAADEDQG